MNVPPMVTAIISLRSSLPPVSDELRKRVQSIRVRSVPDANGVRPSAQQDRGHWRQRQNNSHSTPSANRDQSGGHWRQNTGNLSSGSQSPGFTLGPGLSTAPGPTMAFRFANSPQSPGTDRSPKPTLSRQPSFINSLSQDSPLSTPSTPSIPLRYVSKFHNGTKVGDDKILNTVILNKLNVFSIKTYDDVKQFLFQILGSDQTEFIQEFTWMVFRKAAAEDKFCGLFAKLLSEIKQEYPIIMEEMTKLHTTYLDIWKVSDTASTVDKRCRLGYSQFLAELTALGIIESDTMKLTLETLRDSIVACLSDSAHVETIEEYMDCLKQLCGSRIPKNVKYMIRELLVKDLEKWIDSPKDSVPGLSVKSKFACMDLRDLLVKAA
jgi:hypothetical protein